jgi:hypothetical protein
MLIAGDFAYEKIPEEKACSFFLSYTLSGLFGVGGPTGIVEAFPRRRALFFVHLDG